MCITFHVDDLLAPKGCLITHVATNNAIQAESICINTFDLTCLSFDLLNLGYDIYVAYNGVIIQFYPGMPSKGNKFIRKGCNILKLLLGHYFDSDFNINRNEDTDS